MHGNQDQDELLTLDLAATEFEVSRRTLERLRQAGLLPGRRVGRHLRVRRCDVAAALASGDWKGLLDGLLQPDEARTVEDWSRGWIRYLERSETPGPLLAAWRRWWTALAAAHGQAPVDTLSCGEAMKLPASQELRTQLPVLAAALAGPTPETPLREVLAELHGAFNPLARPRRRQPAASD